MSAAPRLISAFFLARRKNSQSPAPAQALGCIITSGMNDGMNYDVTVIGAGRMGSALAAALFHKGFRTTVWNRTASKTEALSKLGLRVAPSIQDAIREADAVIVNINDYKSTRRLLEQPDIETALRGRIVVQLSSGTPKEAGETDSWPTAAECRILTAPFWAVRHGSEHQPAPSSIPGRRRSSTA